MAPSQVPQHKKMRVTPKQVVPQVGTTAGGDASDAEWTRVENRKAKKTKKVEAKNNVCLVSASFVVYSYIFSLVLVTDAQIHVRER
jgi:hypothetical protein